jgi:hypothetical protein
LSLSCGCCLDGKNDGEFVIDDPQMPAAKVSSGRLVTSYTPLSGDPSYLGGIVSHAAVAGVAVVERLANDRPVSDATEGGLGEVVGADHDEASRLLFPAQSRVCLDNAAPRA